MFNKIAFVGAGSMSEAIIEGMINSNFIEPQKIFVTNKSDRERLSFLENRYHIQTRNTYEELVEGADIIILSVKPSNAKESLLPLKDMITSNQLVISVLAGISTDYISSILENDIPVIRAIPNTSASIGYSATALTKGRYATTDHMAIGESLFNTIGMTVQIEEDDMHTATSIAGSGPAYIYFLVEAMEKTAVELGFDAHTAKELIAQTVIGAGKMLQQSGDSAETLKNNIISPNGTTQAGIETLIDYKFEEAVTACVKNARKRSIELGEE